MFINLFSSLSPTARPLHLHLSVPRKSILLICIFFQSRLLQAYSKRNPVGRRAHWFPTAVTYECLDPPVPTPSLPLPSLPGSLGSRCLVSNLMAVSFRNWWMHPVLGKCQHGRFTFVFSSSMYWMVRLRGPARGSDSQAVVVFFSAAMMKQPIQCMCFVSTGSFIHSFLKYLLTDNCVLTLHKAIVMVMNKFQRWRKLIRLYLHGTCIPLGRRILKEWT